MTPSEQRIQEAESAIKLLYNLYVNKACPVCGPAHWFLFDNQRDLKQESPHNDYGNYVMACNRCGYTRGHVIAAIHALARAGMEQGND